MNRLERLDAILNANPYHVPAGSPNGGQFASKDGNSSFIGSKPTFKNNTMTFEKMTPKKDFRNLSDGVEKWTKKEIDDSSMYYGMGYSEINNILMTGELPYDTNDKSLTPEKKERRERINGYFTTAIDTVKSRLEKSSLSEDTILYRGVSLKRYVNEDSLPDVGDSISYKGFSSTSLDPYEALDWSKSKANKSQDSDGALLLMINAKKGSKAIKRFNEAETEVTLPDNAKLVVKDRKIAYDVYHGENKDLIQKLYVLEVDYE